MSSTSCWTTSLWGALLFALLAAPAWGQVDTTATAPELVLRDTSQTSARAVSPKGALWRSLAVPGWGQLYNRDWVKVPVALGGVGGFGTFALVLNQRTVRHRRAAVYIDCVVNPVDFSDPERVCAEAESFRDEWMAAGDELSAAQNRALRDSNRRNRDFVLLLGFLAYGLQALDAYVSAELADFDVGEDLSLRVVPTPHGPTAALRWTF